jgi:hypothetical protein
MRCAKIYETRVVCQGLNLTLDVLRERSSIDLSSTRKNDPRKHTKFHEHQAS